MASPEPNIKHYQQQLKDFIRTLNDSSPDVVKRSIQAAGRFYRDFVQWLAKPGIVLAEVEETWLLWVQTVNLICGLLESSTNDGVRTHCVKFIETLIIMQTPRDRYSDQGYELNLIDLVIAPIKISTEAAASGAAGLPKGGVLFNEDHKLELVDVAKHRFEQLVIFHGQSHISSVNLMATMQTLVLVAKQRHRLFMGQVIQALESLNLRLPPTLTESQVTSVKKFLKLQLTVMLKHPYSLERFQVQITQLLQAVGSRPPEITRVINDYKYKAGIEQQLDSYNNSAENPKRIKLRSGVKSETGSQGPLPTQLPPTSKVKQLDFNKLTQDLDEKEKSKIVVDAVRRILGDEKCTQLHPTQMDVKKKVLSTLANEFTDTECPQIIQDYIFGDLKNRHEIAYAVIKKNFDVANNKASKRNINLLENQELLKNYFECFNSYLNRAMELKETTERDIILPRLYSLKDEYYSLWNQDQEQEQDDK